jgi:hypothetical protein
MIVVDELRTHDRIKPQARRFGTRWCHLIMMPATPGQPLTDADQEELHAFAARLGLIRTWFQDHARIEFRHYDLVPSKRRLAVTCGAKEVTSREWAQSLQIHRAPAPSTEAIPTITQHILPLEGGI